MIFSSPLLLISFNTVVSLIRSPSLIEGIVTSAFVLFISPSVFVFTVIVSLLFTASFTSCPFVVKTTGVSSSIVFVLFAFVSVVHPVSMIQHSIAINFLFIQVPPIPHSSMHPALGSS